jgi:transposase
MVDIEMYVKIQSLKRSGYSNRKVAKELNIDKRTVKKYWEMDDERYAQYLLESKERSKVLDPYRVFIQTKLENHREITASIIEDNLREKYPEFAVSYRSVRLYVANLREELGLPTSAKIRQYSEVEELPMGFQAQVDLGQKTMEDMYGKKVKVYIFAMVLSFSRKKYIYFSEKPFTAETFVIAHDMAFRYYGGRPSEIVYDQDRVLAVSENVGDLMLTEVFENYRRYAGFSIRLCRSYDPESKGKIEAVVKYVKNNFLKCRTYFGLSRLNSEGLAWLDRTANGRMHEMTKMIPDRAFAEEMKHLKSAPTLNEPLVPRIASVRPTNVIAYKQNRYQVPKGTYYPGRTAEITVDEPGGKVFFADPQTGELLAEHIIESGHKGRLVTLPRNAERYREVAYEDLKIKVLSKFCGYAPAEMYVERIMLKYPRYIRDQLNLISKLQEKYLLADMTKALDYCIERELFSAVDLKDTLEYFSADEPQVTQNVDLPAKYKFVKAEARTLDYYSTGGGSL